MTSTKTKISKKQFKELVQQFQKDHHFIPYKDQKDEYYSFLTRKGEVLISIYKFDKYYFLQIDTLD